MNSLSCNCGCGAKVTDKRVIGFFNYCRKQGWAVSSTIRCEAWNKKSGGVIDSYHLDGLAVDFHGFPDIPEWIQISESFRFTYTKLYPWGYHVDWREL